MAGNCRACRAILLAALVIGTSIVVLAARARGQDSSTGGGDAELMRLVAEGRKAALDKVRSWKGKKTWTREGFTPDGKSFKVGEARTEFAYDAELNGRAWKTESTYYKSGPNHEDMKSIDGALRIDGEYFWLSAEPEKTVRVCALQADDGTSGPPGHGFEIVDQFDYKRDDLFQVYDAYKKWLQEENPVAYLRREGDVVIRGMLSPTGFLNEWKYDLSKGCSVVAFHGYDPDKSSDELKTIEYELVEGTWVPKKVEHTITVKGVLLKKETSEYTNATVNKPLGKEEFTVEKIGLRIGDVISDQRTGLEYKYEGSTTEQRASGNISLADMRKVAIDLSDGKGPGEGGEGAVETTVLVDNAPGVPEQASRGGDSISAWKWPVVVLVVAAFGALAILIAARKRLKRG